MNSQLVQLNVGGKVFKTTQSTLCSVDGYFSKMLMDQNWSEGLSDAPIFIDRDHTVFDSILSYLRTKAVLISPSDDDVYLKRLALEADYYALSGLQEEVLQELEHRAASKAVSSRETFKVVSAADVPYNLDVAGWEYVDNYQGNETVACSSSGAKVPALWRNNACTACGEQMSYEKFSKHSSFIRPTMVVLKKTVTRSSDSLARDDRSSVDAGSGGVGRVPGATVSLRGGGMDADTASTTITTGIQGSLVFDQSFG